MRPSRLRPFVIALAVAGIALPAGATSPWTPDPAFNELDTPGQILFDVATDFDQAYDVGVDGQGRVVVAVGEHATGGTRQLIVVRRYVHDGTLDPTFGSGGVVTGFASAAPNFPARLAIDPVTSTIYLGYTAELDPDAGWDFYVERFTSSGVSTDLSYTNFGPTDTVHDDILTALDFRDGRVVAAGRIERLTGGDWDFGVAAWSADLDRETGFGNGGLQSVYFDLGDTLFDNPTAVFVEGAATVVIGYAKTDAGYDGVGARLDADGELDPTFGSGGKSVFYYQPGFVHAAETLIWDAARVDGGGYVVAGEATHPTQAFATPDFLIGRLDATGTPVPAWQTLGFRLVDLVYPLSTSGDDAAYAVRVDDHGAIVVAGENGSPTTTDRHVAVVRLESDGDLDPTFGGAGGKRLFQPFLAPEAGARALAQRGDGRLYLVGSGDDGTASPGSEGFLVALAGLEVFVDGFEIGNTSAWSGAVP